MRAAFRKRSGGGFELTVSPPVGDTSTGLSSTTGWTAMKLTGAEYGPVFAPSWARARQ